MSNGIPDFINQRLVEKILKNKIQQAFTIKDCQINLVGAKGDNYSSIMCRAVVKIEQNNQINEIKFVVKTLPNEAGAVKYVTETKCFEKEAKMLTECLPEMQRVLQKTKETKPLAAKIYFSEISDKFILAMEDLGVLGFATADRFEGLNLQQCLKVVESLAAFHVSSMVCLKTNPEWMDFFANSIWSYSNSQNTEKSLTSGLQTIIDDIDNWSDEKWSEKLKKIQKQIPEGLYKTGSEINPKRPIVLNHGDLWTNNIMFRQNSKQELELRFVDLQLSWVNSPVFDLMYFLFTAPKREVRFQEMNAILQAYHTKFVQIAKSLKQVVNYSFEELKEDMKEHLIFGFSMFYFVFPVISAPAKDAVDTSNLDDADIFKGNPIFNNKAWRAAFLEGLPFFEKHGLF